jgi:protease I
MKSIAIIIAPSGFQDTEFMTPYNYLKDKGFSIEVYSTTKGLAKGSLGSAFNIEHELKSLDTEKYDAIVFVGGPGTYIVRKDEHALRAAKDAHEKGKLVAAICWSPTILAKSKILNGKKATVWLGDDPEFNMKTSQYIEKNGATYTGDDVTVDDNIITANGPRAAQKYAEAIEHWLKNKK